MNFDLAFDLLLNHEGGYSAPAATCRLKFSLLLSNTPETL